MKIPFYSTKTNHLLFSVFDSKKERKTNQFRNHHHIELEVGFIVSGEAIYHLENDIFTARPGDLFLIRPDERHCVPTITTPELIAFNIQIPPYFIWNICTDFIDSNLLQTLVDTTYPICHYFQDKADSIMQIRDLCSDYKNNQCQIMLNIIALLNSLIQDSSAENISNSTSLPSNKMQDIQNVIEYIDCNFDKQITITQLAKIAKMCRTNLSQQFKKFTGLSPYRYILLQRVEHAVAMLKNSTASIMQISLDCGFTNLANFNRKFKEITGTTPSNYRTMHN